MSWLPRDPSQVGLDPANYDADNPVPNYDPSTGQFVPGAGTSSFTVDAGQPQDDGSVLFRYGIDTAGRPTYDDTGTSDTPAVLLLEAGRFTVEEAPL